MSDALPRNITLIGRLKKEWSRISRDIYSESYTSRQEIVPLDESTQAGVKEKPPLPGALISNGAAYRIPRIRCADPHRLRPPAGALARGLKTLRVFFTPAPCTEFDSPRYGQEIKRQVDTNIYLPVTYGGGAENRTPVHESPLIGISKLSRWFCLGRFARSDTLATS